MPNPAIDGSEARKNQRIDSVKSILTTNIEASTHKVFYKAVRQRLLESGKDTGWGKTFIPTLSQRVNFYPSQPPQLNVIDDCLGGGK